MPASTLSRRVLLRLEQAELLEVNSHLQTDLRIARLTVAHAMRGDAAPCSPHVLASYEVLGLHPDKVFAAVEARRRAQLGPRYEEFWGAKLPPKKPPQSAVGSEHKLWCEKAKDARAVNSRADMQSVLREPTTSVPMAAPSLAAAYRNSDDSGSGKDSLYFTVAELDEFFRTCPPELVPHRELRMIQGMFAALEKRLDKRLHGNHFEFYLSQEDYRAGCRYKSDRTVRYNLPRAVARGYLEIVHRGESGQSHHIWIRRREGKDKGEYRWATTYRLPVSLLERWRHWHRTGHHAHAEVTPIRKPAQPAPTTPPAPAAPAQPKKAAEAPNEETGRRITRDERMALFTAYIALKKSGIESQAALEEVVRQYANRFSAEDIDWAIKVAVSKRGDHTTEAAPPVPECARCKDLGKVWNHGHGPGQKLIPCPECQNS